MMRWVIVIAAAVVFRSSEAETPVETPSPAPAPARAPAPAPKLRTAPKPIDAVETASKPTEADLRRMITSKYRSPKLAAFRAKKVAVDLIFWTQSYDGVDILHGPRSSKQGDRWITRFKPGAAEPAAVRRDKLISADEAVTAAGARRESSTKLVFRPKSGSVQITGTPGNNAVDFFSEIESYQLVYWITNQAEGFYVDAYTGDVLWRSW